VARGASGRSAWPTGAVVADAVDLMAGLGRGSLAALVSILPRRYWLGWTLPVERFAPVSAVLTAALGILIGVDGFVRCAATSLSPSTNSIRAVLPNTLTFLAFARTTPVGLVSSYLAASGAARVAMFLAGRAGGDPLLAIGGFVIRRALRRRAEERTVALRNAQEGPEVADVLVTGEAVGMPWAEWVVIASRLKVGWEPGVFVVTTLRWYRLGVREDRLTPDGLRAFYPLLGVASADVLRRSVYYDHPHLSALQAATADQGPL
jgi:hypothetical protein